MWIPIITCLVCFAVATILFTPPLRKFPFYQAISFYFLFEGKESYILLPRRAFGSAEEEKQFEQLVLAANPGAAWRNFG